MRRVIAFFSIELLAIVFAILQWGIGVRTDEAKYLLSIPYPHPPFLRGVMGLTDGMANQELFWRLVSATLLLQSAWLIWWVAKKIRPDRAVACMILWPLCAAVLSQAGTVMIAVFNAVEGLVFLAAALLIVQKSNIDHVQCFLLGLLWLFSLGSGYQAALYLPAVIVALHKSGARWKEIALYAFGPLALLALYSFANPFALARVVGTAGKDTALTLVDRLTVFGGLITFSGSGIVSILGVIGLLRLRNFAVLGSFICAAGYILLSNSPYYAVLLCPMLVLGAAWLPLPKFWHWILVPLTAVVAFFLIHVPQRSPLVTAMTNLSRTDQPVLLVGPFGHEAQYMGTVIRWSNTLKPEIADSAQSLVCTVECSGYATNFHMEEKTSAKGVVVYERSR